MNSERNRTSTPAVPPRSRERFVTGVVLNQRRRYTLYYLHESSGPVTLDDLARQVAAWERATTPDEVSAEHAESVRSSLRRTHLPYLAESGFVAYDDRRNLARGRVENPQVAVFLANEPRTTVPWYKVYLVSTAVSAVLVGLVQFGVPPFDRVSPIAAAALVMGLFAVASLGYWYDIYRWRRRTDDTPPDFLVTLEEDVPLKEEDELENGDRSDSSERDDDRKGKIVDDDRERENVDDRNQ
jgi:hypothetical protein